jgi:hypothetical protein
MTPDTQKKVEATSTRTILLITLAMFGAAIFFILWSGYEIVLAYQSQQWPSVEGEITSSYVQRDVRAIENSSKKPTYTPKISYQYTVNGKTYTGEKISFSGGEGGEKKNEAQAVVDHYFSGKKIAVYYDPEHPKKAVLETGFRWQTFMPCAAGLGFLIVGIICLKAYQKDKTE